MLSSLSLYSLFNFYYFRWAYFELMISGSSTFFGRATDNNVNIDIDNIFYGKSILSIPPWIASPIVSSSISSSCYSSLSGYFSLYCICFNSSKKARVRNLYVWKCRSPIDKKDSVVFFWCWRRRAVATTERTLPLKNCVYCLHHLYGLM